MNALAWIKDRGYPVPEDVSAQATDFFWLWSFFEYKCLDKWADPRKIKAFVDGKRAEISNDKARILISYFRSRYVDDGRINEKFESLNWRTGDGKGFVQSVLEGLDQSGLETYQASLLIVYRFRNNLFHGPKWEGIFEGQRDNFVHANELLKEVLQW